MERLGEIRAGRESAQGKSSKWHSARLADERLLNLLADQNALTPEMKSVVLAIQAHERLMPEYGVVERSGAIALRLGFISREVLDSAIKEQRTSRRTKPIVLGWDALPLTRGILVAIAVLAIAWAILTQSFPRGFAIAGGIVFCWAVTEIYLNVMAHPGLLRAVSRAMASVLFLIGFGTVVAVAVLVYASTSILAEHLAVSGRAIAQWTLQVKITLLLVAGCSLAVIMKVVWWRTSARYAVARAHVLSEMVFITGQVLRNYSGSDKPNGSNVVRRLVSLVRTAMHLTVEERLIRLVPGWCRAITALYLVPDADSGASRSTSEASSHRRDRNHSRGRGKSRREGIAYRESAELTGFRIVEIVTEPSIEKRTARMQQWVKEQHRPRAWNRRLFAELVREVKVMAPRRWATLYRRHPRRREVGSLTGWVFEHNQIAWSNDARASFQFGQVTLEEELRAQGYIEEEVRWLRAASFFGCPVRGPGGKPVGVLLVFKNRKHGFVPGDFEFVITTAELLGSVVSRHS